jgi:hypothetical protein
LQTCEAAGLEPSDGSALLLAKWGEAIGPNPTDRGKPGTERDLTSDAQRIPLAVRLSAAHVHHSVLFDPVLDAASPTPPSVWRRPLRRQLAVWLARCWQKGPSFAAPSSFSSSVESRAAVAGRSLAEPSDRYASVHAGRLGPHSTGAWYGDATCSRFARFAEPEEFAEHFGVTIEDVTATGRYDIAAAGRPPRRGRRRDRSGLGEGGSL